MFVKHLIQLLETNPDAELHILLPTGEWVPDHFHVTEVGRVAKTFIDCGGMRREAISCLLQTWTADDIDHRLVAGKLASILKLAQTMLDLDDLPVEVEYGPTVAAQYTVTHVDSTALGLMIHLGGKRTDCLAPDRCGISKSNVSGCC